MKKRFITSHTLQKDLSSLNLSFHLGRFLCSHSPLPPGRSLESVFSVMIRAPLIGPNNGKTPLLLAEKDLPRRSSRLLETTSR
ncbi:MAG: hypothetical protein LLG04_14515 [Parachlamydia sp.]|nr:hypothetical protein [Parachlamydia sp.]